MSLIEYIILSFALGFEVMIVLQACARHTPIQLSKGLVVSSVIALISALLLAGGMVTGGLLRFTPSNMDSNAVTTNELFAQTDELVYLGLLLVVAFRLFFKSFKKNRVAPYDISRMSTVFLLAIVLGINVLIVGLALGFHVSISDNIWKAAIPLAVVFFLLGMLGIMYGRRQVDMRARRWTLIAVLFILVFAVKDFIWK